MVRVLFRAYKNLKTTRLVNFEMLEKRKVLQLIGRDKLSTKELIAFIDWRNKKIEYIKELKD